MRSYSFRNVSCMCRGTCSETLLKKEKILIVEHDFFSKSSSQLGVFWPRRGLQPNNRTVRKSAISF